MPEGQHQAGRRAADVLHLDVDVERRGRLLEDADAEQRPVAAPAAAPVVTVAVPGSPSRV